MQNTGYRLRIRRAGGFTLAEVLITLVIIGFIGALGIPMLGQTKLKHPTEVKARHGTMECFYDGSTLYQYEANNGENRMGELTTPTDACYFSAPAANIFVVQAVGTGGNGAVGSGTASYSNYSGLSQSGSISTGEAFYSNMTAEETPNWVRENWNSIMSAPSRWVRYKLTSPVGASGAADCQRRKFSETCTTLCYDHVEDYETCPPSCTFDLLAIGGNSGSGAEMVVKAPLEFDPEGIKDDVQFTMSVMETKLAFNSGKYVSMKASRAGTSGIIERPSGGHKEDGKNGDDYTADLIDMSGNIQKESDFVLLGNGQQGSSSCEHKAGKDALRGSISILGPSSISYSASVLGVNARYGVAGSAGQSSMKLVEQIPEGTRLKMIPSKDTSQKSYVYMENEGGGWDLLMEAGPGTSGYMTSSLFAIEEGDLPFPASYYPESFRPQTAEVSIASGQGYRSELVSRGISPGSSGGGTHPLITHVSGVSTYKIDGVAVGSGPLAPVSGSGACVGLSGGGGICGSPNSPGTQGAVIVSW